MFDFLKTLNHDSFLTIASIIFNIALFALFFYHIKNQNIKNAIKYFIKSNNDNIILLSKSLKYTTGHIDIDESRKVILFLDHEKIIITCYSKKNINILAVIPLKSIINIKTNTETTIHVSESIPSTTGHTYYLVIEWLNNKLILNTTFATDSLDQLNTVTNTLSKIINL